MYRVSVTLLREDCTKLETTVQSFVHPVIEKIGRHWEITASSYGNPVHGILLRHLDIIV